MATPEQHEADFRRLMAETHEGEILGIEPTGTELSWTGVAIDRYEDGRIAEAWLYPDWLAILDQLGVLPEEVEY